MQSLSPGEPAGAGRLGSWLIGASLAVAVVLFLALPPIPQWPEYHDFADRRAWLGVPRFADVASNVPFSLIGLMGLTYLLRRGGHAFVDRREAPAWYVYFLGLVLLGPASGVYHLAPDNDGLMLDRLAMSVVFMAWLAIHLGERLGPRLGLGALPVLLVLGLSAVLYWYVGEGYGQGDLRPWGYVQFWPVLLVLWLVARRPARYSGGGAIVAVYACYAAALLAEWLDHEILAVTGLISGHTLKHLLAATGAAWALLWLMRRRPVQPMGAS
jgi:hypothetical protein